MKRIYRFVLAALTSVATSGLLFAQTDSIMRRRLETEQVIDSVRCAPTGRAYAEFYSFGALRSCPLARDTVIQGNALPAGTWIGLNDGRELDFAWLPHDTELGGHPCHGVGYKGYSVRFYGNGALRLCFLAEDTAIEEIPCVHGSFWTEIRGGSNSVVNFFPNGSLAGCQLSRDLELNGTVVKKWTRIGRTKPGAPLGPRIPRAP